MTVARKERAPLNGYVCCVKFDRKKMRKALKKRQRNNNKKQAKK